MANITNGTVSVNVTGGVGPYQYTLLNAGDNQPVPQNAYSTFQNPANSVTANSFTFGNASDVTGNSGLQAGSYKIKIVDANGCETFSSILVVTADAPNPTATPAPTAIPDPTATPVPDPTATAIPDPTATAIPDPTATAIPDPTATPVPDPTATAIPDPTATAIPDPTATAIPDPTATAIPDPTATPVPEPTFSINGPDSINEGDTQSYTFMADSMATGTTVYWELRNFGATDTYVAFGSDIVTARTGNGVTTDNGSGGSQLEIAIEVATDSSDETAYGEQFKLVVWDDAANYATPITYSGAISGELAQKVIAINEIAPTPTPVPDPTATAIPDPTATAIPDPTATPVPDPTATAIPDPTATPVPDPTATPVPTATAIPDPTATAIPDPTATPAPEQADAYYFHLGSGGYPYAQDLIGGTLYKADNSVAANYDESFADMLANPGSYEQVNSLSAIVNGTSFTIPASSSANFYWLAIPVDMIGDDLTVHKRFEIDGAPADSCSASLAFVGPNGTNYNLYKLNTVPMTIELPIVYVV